MAETFRTGEIVQLKSGGPKMTVKGEASGLGVHCQWFAGSKLDQGYFPKESLIKLPPDAKEKK